MMENPCSNQEIHVLFEHGFKLENFQNKPQVICMTSYMESVADHTDHFPDAFVCEMLCTAMTLFLFVLLIYVPSQQLWSWQDGQFI